VCVCHIGRLHVALIGPERRPSQVELVHRGRYLVDWPTVAWREPFRRLLDLEAGEAWLRTEEYQDGDSTVVRAELPGIDPEKDLEVTVAGGVLRIHAHREHRADHIGKDNYRSEFRYGEFVREILLTEEAAIEDIQASYKNGILELRIPSHEKVKLEVTKVPVVPS
jgi:HSP20 family protein